LLISDLKNPEYWREKEESKEESDVSKDFRDEIFRLISPYKGVQNFKVFVSVNGRALESEKNFRTSFAQFPSAVCINLMEIYSG